MGAKRQIRSELPLVLLIAWLATHGAALAAPPTVPSIVTDLDRPCRNRDENAEIVVCGQRDAPRSPYRIPPPPDRFDPTGEVPSVLRERHSLMEHGDTGIGSCSTVGPGGYTGCAFRQWKADRQQWGGRRPQPGAAR